MPESRLPHIFLQDHARAIQYRSRQTGRNRTRIPHRSDPQQHAARIRSRLEQAWQDQARTAQERSAVSLPVKEGMYLEFRNQAAHDLIIWSLENLPSGIRLLNVKQDGEADNAVTIATVFVPQGKENFFLKRIQDYAEQNKNQKLIDSIEDIRLAVLVSFWQDKRELIPSEQPQWCEVWLRVGPGHEREAEERFRQFCRDSGIPVRDGQIRFPERSVVLARADEAALSSLIEANPDIAELRLAKATAEFWVELPNEDQVQAISELLARTRFSDNGVSVCVLDTGANNGHPLLSPVLADAHRLTVNLDWGESDHHPHGHGTAMCGIAVYGDLQNLLLHSNPVEIDHRLESVKILPRGNSQNHKELWGHITGQAVSRAEIQKPEQLRIHCMAVTSEDARDRGRPSSWSAAIDALASGYGEGDRPRRLFIMSAGNVHDPEEWRNYHESNLTNAVHDPGQAWNALTVGAITYKNTLNNSDLQDYEPLAPAGGLSPFTTTSLTWESKWPNKPDIVVEGGNAAIDGAGFPTTADDLSLLSTHHEVTARHFSCIAQTSAAAGIAAQMAAKIQAAYPQAWPETVRGLLVHSASWNETLKEQLGVGECTTKTQSAKLLRICGYGEPDLEQALYCAGNALTLIAQEEIQPFIKEDSRGKTKDMHVYELPWPREALLELGDTLVDLRATISFFIEPGPGEIGWKDRYRYASHALRFDIKTPTESRQDFVRRLNAAADEEGSTGSDSGSHRWLIGTNARSLGSVHSDIWTGTATEIAASNLIGVYPVIGWWRERRHLGRCNDKTRYSLIVSLRTPEQNVDIYTPVVNLVQPAVTIKTR